MNFFELIGGLGIILISIGIIIKRRKAQDIFYICGGICLETYSIYIGDIIFIVLQIIFILAAVFDLIKVQLQKKDALKT